MPLASVDQLLQQAQYRGMGKGQSDVMRRWLEQNYGRFDRVDFEVHVGQGAVPLPEWSPAMAAEYRYQTQKRIDAVAWAGHNTVLVEIKNQLNLQAIGQLLSYRLFWMQLHPELPEPSMVMAGETADQDVIAAAHAHGIDVELYPTEVV